MRNLKPWLGHMVILASGAAVALPAYATTAPIPVPEPTTMTLAAVASAGVVLAYRLFR